MDHSKYDRGQNDLAKPRGFYARKGSKLFDNYRPDRGAILFQEKEDFGRDNKGVSSDSREYEDFRISLRDALNSQFPAKIDEDGFATDYPVTRNFNALEATTGFKATPFTCPPVDNDVILTDLGIKTSGFVSQRHQRISEALFKCMFRRRTEANYHLAKTSSTGFPSHVAGEKSKALKLVTVEAILDNLDFVLDLLEEGKYEEANRKFGLIFCYKNGLRLQPESKDKARKVRTRSGDEIVADKTSALRAIGLERSGAMRVRTVFGLSGALNYMMSCFLVGRRKAYLHEYEYTWHHTGPHQIYDKLSGAASVVGVDVTQMDQAMPVWFLDWYADQLGTIWDPRVANVVKKINRAPYYQPAVDELSSAYFRGDPGDESTWNIKVGLASGRFDVPDLGKLWMMTNYIILLDDIFGILSNDPNDDVHIIHTLLKGEHHRFGCLNMGDDNVFVCKYAVDGERIREKLQSGKASPYTVMDVEDGCAFVGNILLRDNTKTILVPKPDLVSMAVNRFSPEHGVTSGAREFWGSGFIAAMDHYSDIGSEAEDLKRLVKDIWRYTVPDYPDPFVCAKEHSRYKRVLAPITSYADAEVLMDPSKRFYKYTEADISPEILELFSWTIESEMIEKKIRSFERDLEVYPRLIDTSIFKER